MLAGPAAPQNTSQPTISGTARDGETLTADPGTWTHDPQFTYEWSRCDADGLNCGVINSTTDPTYALTHGTLLGYKNLTTCP